MSEEVQTAYVWDCDEDPSRTSRRFDVFRAEVCVHEGTAVWECHGSNRWVVDRSLKIVDLHDEQPNREFFDSVEAAAAAMFLEIDTVEGLSTYLHHPKMPVRWAAIGRLVEPFR